MFVKSKRMMVILPPRGDGDQTGEQNEKKLTHGVYPAPRLTTRQDCGIQNAEKINRKRFEKQLSNDEALKNQLRSLPDNSQWIPLKFMDSEGNDKDGDHWVVDIGSSKSFKRNPLLQGDVDYLMASNHGKFKSDGKFQARRRGNKVEIKGDVVHDWGDMYDFNVIADLGIGAGAASLNKAGRAKNYPMKSRWKQNIIGEFELKNDKAMPIYFEWEDAR